VSERTANAAWLPSASSRRRVPGDPALIAGALVALGLLTVALLGERLAPHQSIYFVIEHSRDPRPYDPGLVFPFGSDILGRDLFSLVLAGARATLAIVVLAGLARVVAGVVVAALGSWWRPLRVATESVADLASAVPATLVALVLVKVFVRAADTSVLVFIGALLVTGWAGPYRVVRAELDRLTHARFSEGAAAIGVGRWRLFWRHQLPHLVPTLVMNLSQQIVASLVLLAELGVLGVFVGATRQINVEESLSRVETGIVNFAQIADLPEWGGLLASARTIESLWTTRWLVLVPGVAFALTGIAVAVIGLVVARRYARRDVIEDLRSRGAAVFALTLLVVFVVAVIVPPRYAAATGWANDARGALQPTTDVPAAFAAAGLQPLAPSYAIGQNAARVVQSAGATVQVGGISITEKWPHDTTRPFFTEQVRSFVTSSTGGGVVEAPLVFVARGITPSDYPPPVQTSLYGGKLPELGETIKDYPDDYAGLDVRGKVVLLVRFMGVRLRPESSRVVSVPPAIGVEESIATAIRHGAAAVLFVDPAVPGYTDRPVSYTVGGTGVSPYSRAEQAAPPTATGGVPVVLLSDKAATPLTSAYGIDLSPLLGQDLPDAWARRPSVARDLGVAARVAVPLERKASTASSYVGEVAGAAHDAGHVLVWAVRRPGDPNASADVLAALGRTLALRASPFIFVDFDDSVDPKANAQLIKTAFGDRRISLVIVLGNLTGDALKLTTANGELIPAFDLYAAQSGARAVMTQSTAAPTALDGIAPFVALRTVVVDSAGGTGDLRPDAAAFVGYLAGRLALDAEELPK
jgi:ABC-type dipeptide/oligopeptide/nickel transport system permease subunit